MEMASYLAGERWSDRPACTHPLLAALARLVNDHTSDAARSELVTLIPSVIGLTSDDPRVDVRIMLRAATTALPVASAERQRSLAVAVLAAEHALDVLEERYPAQIEERSRDALDQVPDAARWAQRFSQRVGPATPEGIQDHGAPAAVRLAVLGIAQACISNPDALLHELLATTIDDCARLLGPVVTGRPGSGPARPAGTRRRSRPLDVLTGRGR
jgi:hypothetical protein